VEARAKLNCTCGCGFKHEDLDVAKAHTERTGHLVTVLGIIHPIPQTQTEAQMLQSLSLIHI